MFKVNQKTEQVINQVLNFMESATMIVSFHVTEKGNKTILEIQSDEVKLEYSVRGQQQEKKMKTVMDNLLELSNEIFNGKYNDWIKEASLQGGF